MSQENVELAARARRAVVHEQGGAVGPHVVDDGVLPPRGRVEPTRGGWVHWPRWVREALEEWLESFDEYRYEVQRIVDCGGRCVLVVGVEVGKGAMSGAEVRSVSYELLTFREGMIVRSSSSTTRAMRPRSRRAVGVGMSQENVELLRQSYEVGIEDSIPRSPSMSPMWFGPSRRRSGSGVQVRLSRTRRGARVLGHLHRALEDVNIEGSRNGETRAIPFSPAATHGHVTGLRSTSLRACHYLRGSRGIRFEAFAKRSCSRPSKPPGLWRAMSQENGNHPPGSTRGAVATLRR